MLVGERRIRDGSFFTLSEWTDRVLPFAAMQTFGSRTCKETKNKSSSPMQKSLVYGRARGRS